MLIWVLSSSILENDSINILLMGIMMVLASIPVTVMIRVFLKEEERLYQQGRRFYGTIVEWKRIQRLGNYPVYEFYTEAGWHKVQAISGGATWWWRRKAFEETHHCVWYDPELADGIRIQTRKERKRQKFLICLAGILLWMADAAAMVMGIYELLTSLVS